MASAAATLSSASSSWLQNRSLDKTLNKTPTIVSKRGSPLLIILKDDVSDLGKKGQLLDVKAGFYRNFLLPMGKALIVTPVLLKTIYTTLGTMLVAKIVLNKYTSMRMWTSGLFLFLTFGKQENIAELKLHPEVTARVTLNVFAN